MPSRELIDLVNRDAFPAIPIDRRIAELQQALGDSATGTGYIENVPNLGSRPAAAVALAEPSATVTPFPEVRADPERPVFVAREAELARLDGFVQQAIAGTGRVAFVTGEAGTGKTALIQELARLAGEACPDLVVAVGVCSAQTGIGDAYAPWRQLLALLTGDVESGAASGSMMAGLGRRLWRTAPLAAEAVAESGRDLVGTLLPGAALLGRAEAAAPAGASWLGPLRELVRRKALLPPDAALQQAAVFMQVARVLGAVARRRPLLLVLEDLHWADAGSIALLFHLSREVDGPPNPRARQLPPDRRGARPRRRAPPARAGGGRAQGPSRSSWRSSSGRSGDRGFVDALVDSEPNRLGGGLPGEPVPPDRRPRPVHGGDRCAPCRTGGCSSATPRGGGSRPKASTGPRCRSGWRG